MKLFIKTLFILFFSFSNYAQDVNCKCCSEKYSEFDFWLGIWTVTNSEGKIVGRNEIDKIQDHCILRENWTSAEGKFTGTSNNFYNSITKQWEQIWIDNQGGSLHLKGNRDGNQMILKTDVATNKEGNSFYHRITWSLNDDGSVTVLGNNYQRYRR